MNAVHPEDRDYIVENWRRAVETETPLNTEYRLYHAPSEQWRWTKARAVRHGLRRALYAAGLG